VSKQTTSQKIRRLGDFSARPPVAGFFGEAVGPGRCLSAALLDLMNGRADEMKYRRFIRTIWDRVRPRWEILTMRQV
jgi:hypothetical protein